MNGLEDELIQIYEKHNEMIESCNLRSANSTELDRIVQILATKLKSPVISNKNELCKLFGYYYPLKTKVVADLLEFVTIQKEGFFTSVNYMRQVLDDWIEFANYLPDNLDIIASQKLVEKKLQESHTRSKDNKIKNGQYVFKKQIDIQKEIDDLYLKVNSLTETIYNLNEKLQELDLNRKKRFFTKRKKNKVNG